MNYIRLPNGMSSTFYQPCISAAISFAKDARAAALLPLTADFTVVVFSQILQLLSVSTASRIFCRRWVPMFRYQLSQTSYLKH